MSRLIVKNLPKNYSAEKLKEHFSQRGQVTDAALARTPDGRTRRFGFVGYRTDREASEAVRYFNNTYIYTSKIIVEHAKVAGDKDISRPWSRYTAGTTAYNAAHGVENTLDSNVSQEIHTARTVARKTNDDGTFSEEFSLHNRLKGLVTTDDSKLREYMAVMRSRKGAENHVWTNDDAAGDVTTVRASAIKSVDDDLYEDIPSIKKSTSEQEVSEGKTSVSEHDIKENTTFIPSKSTREGGSTDSTPLEMVPAQIADGETLEKKQVVPIDVVADTGRLFVKNIPYTCTTEDLKEFFAEYGPLTEVHIPITIDTKKPKGFAFVQFMFPEKAVKAFLKLDNTAFQGRLLKIYPGMDKVNHEEEGDDDSLTYKAKKDKERKKNAVKEFSWNTLFMNSDAVAAAIAKKLNVTKSDVMNPEDDGLATRLALAETHIIAETKEYLIQSGVDLDAFQLGKGRSNTIILVKNITADTDIDEIETMFGAHGTLSRVVLPPTKTVALVEFIEPNEAKSAFMRLAYKKLHHIPMFLEWAPIGALKPIVEGSQPEVRKTFESVATVDSEQRRVEAGLQSTATDSNTEVEDDAGTTTLFVKNLNFTTTTETLTAAFADVKGFVSARVSTKQHPKTGEKLSMGFGFMTFSSREDARDCMKQRQHTKLDGHVLQLKLSTPTVRSGSTSSRSAAVGSVRVGGTKLIVRNIPFEATKRDVQQLFRAFGNVKSLRLPRKFDGTHRGFGFVDFLTRQEARTAFETLGATHLYGRHLVLEWADDSPAPGDVVPDVVSKSLGSEKRSSGDDDNGLLAPETDEPASKRMRNVSAQQVAAA